MGIIKDIDETQAPLLDHLIELRKRLVRCVLALAVAFAVCLYFADDIFALLVRPLAHAFPNGDGKLIYTKLYEAFFVEVKVALFAAFLVSFPVIANQIWVFVAPGLYRSEKRALLPFLAATPVLFILGAALGIAGLIIGLKSIKGNSNMPGIIGVVLSCLILLAFLIAVAFVAAYWGI